jgi:hypothetical protein
MPWARAYVARVGAPGATQDEYDVERADAGEATRYLVANAHPERAVEQPAQEVRL